jgi:osmotically-inducible protein OsmY
MKQTNTTSPVSKVLTLALCLGALPLVSLVTGCAGDRYHQSTGENIDDHATTMRVKSALGNNAEYKFDGVNVDTFKGTVQLSGFVNTSTQKSQAADIAKGVDGVKDVQNNITVKE